MNCDRRKRPLSPHEKENTPSPHPNRQITKLGVPQFPPKSKCVAEEVSTMNNINVITKRKL